MTRAIRDDLTAILHFLHTREDFHRDLCDSCGFEVGTTLSGLRARLERLYAAMGRECTCPPSAYDPRSHLIGCPVVSVQSEPPARPACDCSAPAGALPEAHARDCAMLAANARMDADIVGRGALFQAGWEAGRAWERAESSGPLPACAGDIAHAWAAGRPACTCGTMSMHPDNHATTCAAWLWHFERGETAAKKALVGVPFDPFPRAR